MVSAPEHIMKIQVQQRGGFAGITHTLVDLDSATLDPGMAAQIESLAKRVESAASTKRRSRPGLGADYLMYDVTVQDGENSRTLTLVDDDSVGMAQIRTLLDQLSALARSVH